jgi:hypothetical protein
LHCKLPTLRAGTLPLITNSSADNLKDHSGHASGNDADINFGQKLWEVYKNGNLEELTNLSKHQSLAFPYLQEVVKAHVDRFPKDGTKGRPEKVIEDITKNISTDFHKVLKSSGTAKAFMVLATSR